MKRIIVITGPTGVGKTKLSIELAKKINAEIINADSVQVYKKLNIGSAKITEEEKEGIPHHLLDIVEPNDMYTIYDYQRDGRKIIDDVLKADKNIIIVGGSGLYIKALLYNYELEEEKVSFDFSDLTNEEIYNEIHKIDCENDVHINNRKRLERELTKLKNDVKKENHGNEKLYNFALIGLTTDRKKLYSIIDNRVDKMIEEGLLNEVEELYNNKINSKAINTAIGYKELYKYFDNEITLEEAKELIKRNSRRYAKRQYTFFNNQMDIKWFNTDYECFDNTIKEVLNYVKNY